MDISEFQSLIRDTYGDRDRDRGLERSFAWFVEEVGELSRAIFRQDETRRHEEFADVLAWLTTLADLTDTDLATAATRYAHGCPTCHHTPCTC